MRRVSSARRVVLRLDNVGIVVEDLASAIAFFLELGLVLEGQGMVEGEWAGRVTGLGHHRVEIAMLGTPDPPRLVAITFTVSVRARTCSTTSAAAAQRRQLDREAGGTHLVEVLHPTGSANACCAATAASMAARAEPNAAHTPSPVCLNSQPPRVSIADRRTSSWSMSAVRIASGSASHRRVEPSISVNRNVTVPEGRCSPTGRERTHRLIRPRSARIAS